MIRGVPSTFAVSFSKARELSLRYAFVTSLRNRLICLRVPCDPTAWASSLASTFEYQTSRSLIPANVSIVWR
jgi:hypothetical protein